MDEKTALEDLSYIKSIITQTRKNMLHNGMDYIFWGILVITGMLFQYILILNQVHFSYILIWAVLIPIGWLYSIYNGRKMHKKHPSTYSGKIITGLWIASGISMTMVGFIGVPLGGLNPMFISPVICLIVGVDYFVSGLILDSKWFQNLSYGWWAGAVAMFFIQDVHQFLVMALVMLFFQTIPGFIMYKKYKNEVALAS